MPRVLIVDDDEEQLLLIQETLGSENLEIVVAQNAKDTFEAIYRQIPDLIILDIGLTGEDGFDILRSIRVEPQYDAVPIVIYSASHDIESKTKALDLGAVEYLEKPLHTKELAAHVRAILRFKLKQDQSIEEYKRLSELSLTDPLTGAYNRRALDTFLKARLSESTRHGIPCRASCSTSIISRTSTTRMAIKSAMSCSRTYRTWFAAFAGRRTRLSDMEVKSIILFHTPRDDAEIFGERVRESVAEHEFRSGDLLMRITISGGIASKPEDDLPGEPEAMIRLADRRLYTAKRNGRDQVVSSDT